MAETIKEAIDKVGEGVKQLAVGGKENKAQAKPKKDKKAGKEGAAAAGPDELETPAPYIDHRIQIFEKLKKQYDADIAAKPREPINITLPDGKIIAGTSWETSPADVARGISKSLFEKTVISKVEGELWDIERPFEKSSKLELLDFENEEAKKVYWHSSAHILGEAAERRWGCDLCIGPPVEDGFYYEMALPGGATVAETDFEPLERIANKAIKEKQRFERLTLSKENLLEMFASNKYKQHIIKDKIPDGTSTTVYRCGPLIDLCRGPHVPDTGRIKTFKVMKNSASYFLGDAANDSLQRIYGISFPDKKLMAEHLKYLEEAAKRDHRKIGTQQELFFFHEMSPGSAFLLPHGTLIFNALQTFLRSEYRKRDYQEVQSPNMYNANLWKVSGHWDFYKDDMFTFRVEKEDWALKPMNCPGHCLLFSHRERSYRELPMRVADFGVLHRNEASGALSGLTRVRKFQQDDTHVFCTQAQVVDEILALFDFLDAVYSKFGFTFKMKLSTRPDKFLGDIETWDGAEAKLTQALDAFQKRHGVPWELNPGDGAFYGPKIDITISDALRREFQCATIQLDFQLPQRFGLEYMTDTKTDKPKDDASAAAKPAPAKVPEPTPGPAPTSNATTTELLVDPKKASDKTSAPEFKYTPPREPLPGYARPVMLHRAIYGSFERFLAILIEHFAGKWPFWLSPRQILVIPVMPSANDYVLEVQKIFKDKEMHCDVDISGNTMQKKIRTGQLASYNFIFVVGAQERESRTVNIRNRDDMATQAKGELIPLDVAIEKLVELRDQRRIANSLDIKL